MDEKNIPAQPELSQAEMEEQMKAFQAAEQIYLEQSFKWLIDFVAGYFPEDQLVVEDVMTDVHFIQSVVEGGKPLGALVYRFRKVQDKKAYFGDLRDDYKEGLGVPEVLFVDSETAVFESPASLESEDGIFEISARHVTSKIRELREELKRRAKIRQLRESL
jgi:hypothetical protein